MTERITVSREGFVRRGKRELGQVRKIRIPYQVITQDGTTDIMERRYWEARRPHQVLEVNPWGFPMFDTRREAVDHLANN